MSDNHGVKYWLLCPISISKTKVKIRKDTLVQNFLLYCPKCKRETLISVDSFKITVIKEPDAKT